MGDAHSLLHDLRSGALDVVLRSLPTSDPSLEEEPLWNYELVFVLPPRRLAGWQPKGGLASFADKPFILFRRHLAIDRAIRELCASAGLIPRVVMESDDPDSIVNLVRLGLGFSILPLWTVGEDWKKKRVFVLRGPEPAFHTWGLVYHRASRQPEALTNLCAVASDWRYWWPLAEFVSPVSTGG